MGETVVILAPNSGRNQAVPRTNRSPPGNLLTVFQPFAVLVIHRRDHMGERLIGVEKAIATSEKVTLHHSHQRVLRKHLNDRAIL